ncbi:MAG: HAMP domain-containing sensor histidine kinase, partial [Nitrososphaeraceae archaeon]
LDVTRIESGSLELNLRTFDLNRVISDVIDDYRNEIERSGSDVKLIHEGQNETIQVQGDKNRLTQVISNLVDNAVKFTRQGSITIKAVIEKEEDGSKALVSVKDTGSGIEPEIMPRLFTKFVAKSDKGTGLGLFISKSIIEAHGGRIWALNNYSLDGNSSKGATFAFNISLSRITP